MELITNKTHIMQVGWSHDQLRVTWLRNKKINPVKPRGRSDSSTKYRQLSATEMFMNMRQTYTCFIVKSDLYLQILLVSVQ